MSRENVELVRRLAAAFQDRGPEALPEFFNVQVEWHEDPSFPEAGVYRGLEAVQAYVRQFMSEFSEIHYEPVHLDDVGDHVIANMRITGLGKASGARFEISAWWAMTLREGKLTRCYACLDRDRALEAVGLRE